LNDEQQVNGEQWLGEVRLEDLTKEFGDFTAVDAIDLHMPPGEFFTMVGPSGCGKTTTLRRRRRTSATSTPSSRATRSSRT
jgi:ABC-type nitrate/sulfonate/bicarbonate transport system ATPase subunit